MQMLSIPLFSFIGLAIAQSNGTIGYVEPDTNTGQFGSNIGMAISQDLNTFDDNVIYNDSYIPQPIRGSMGSNFQTNENVAIDRISPDVLAPPTVDYGSVPNPRWPMSLSHNRLAIGGFARQQTVKELPVATDIAGVDMKLDYGAFRESHWHEQSEWAYVFSGRLIVSAVGPDGKSFYGELGAGDVWFFPASYVHSIQAISEEGSEFLLVFDDGEFDEDSTFLAAELLSRIPKSVINKNFQLPPNATDFDNIPAQQLYIFNGRTPVPSFEEQSKVDNPYGRMNQSLVMEFSQTPWTEVDGGKYKLIDSSNFNPPELDITAVKVHLEPGSMRPIHWHKTDEWDFVISGMLRVGIYAANGNSRTFNFVNDDVGYIKKNSGHYIECVSSEPCEYLEIFKTDTYNEFSFNQFMAVSPKYTIAQHFRISDETIDNISKEKLVIVPNNQ